MVNTIVVRPENVAVLEKSIPSDNVTLKLETVKVKFGNIVIEVPSAMARFFAKA